MALIVKSLGGNGEEPTLDLIILGMMDSDIEQKSVGEFNLRVIVQFHIFFKWIEWLNWSHA